MARTARSVISVAHRRALIEGNIDRRNFFPRFASRSIAAISVEEEGHVAIFLSFGNGEGSQARCCKLLADGRVDGGRFHQIVGRNLPISIVLHHASEEHRRVGGFGETRKVILSKGFTEFDGSVAAKVEEDD